MADELYDLDEVTRFLNGAIAELASAEHGLAHEEPAEVLRHIRRAHESLETLISRQIAANQPRTADMVALWYRWSHAERVATLNILRDVELQHSDLDSIALAKVTGDALRQHFDGMTYTAVEWTILAGKLRDATAV